MTTGKLRLEMRPVELEPVIEATLDAMLPAARAKSIVVDRLFEAKGAMAMADPDRLQRVRWNVFGNAVKFTPHGGRVARAGRDLHRAAALDPAGSSRRRYSGRCRADWNPRIG